MAAIDVSLQTLQLDEAVDEARGLSSLPPDLIVHCCRFVTATDYAAMTSVCRAIRQALVQVDNKMWMAWAFERFRRLKLLMAHVHARDEIDWKRLYKAQLAAEAVPPNQAVQLTSTVEDFTFNVQIARGPRATEEAGKVELEWAGKIEAVGGSAMLRLWEEEEGHPFWLQECVGPNPNFYRDLRLSLWVSKFAAHMPTTVCLLDKAPVEEQYQIEMIRDDFVQVKFHPDWLPDAQQGIVDARNDAHFFLHQQVVPNCGYMTAPLIQENGVMLDVVVSYSDDNGMVALTTEQTLIYLQHGVPWMVDLEP